MLILLISSMKDSDTYLKPGGKHVSKACLECRRRHFKCNGQIPTCDRCLKNSVDCVYVVSNRGGARTKGIKKESVSSTLTPLENKKVSTLTPFDIEDAPRLNVSNVREDRDDFLSTLKKLPCAKDGNQCKDLNCTSRDLVTGKTAITDETSESVRKRMKLDMSINNLNCMFAPKVESSEHEVSNLNFVGPVSNVNNKMLLQFNQREILDNYYATFHKAHPFLPPRDQIEYFLVNTSCSQELLFMMKIVGDGQIGSLYSRNVDFIHDRLIQLVEIIKLNPVHDLVTLQVLILLSLIAHISSLHHFSRDVRQYCIHLTTMLKINLLDNLTRPSLVTQSARLAHIPQDIVYDNARRTFWELYFFDVIIGSADGITLTELSKIPTEIDYPASPAPDLFDYKARSETSKLVTLAIVMNNEIKDKRPHEQSLARLKAQLSNWELKLADPLAFGQPMLIHKDGTINEGVHQAVLMFDYAKIFAHRPFSYLWKTNAPQNPKCDDKMLEAEDLPTQLKADANATIETIKTIDAANSILGSLMDTNSSKILDRTPLFACALALASLVYTSAYIWVELIVELDDLDLKKASKLGENDLELYGEYIQLSLSAIYPISKHWILSGKLASHVRSALQALRPKLYSKMKDSLPQIEISIEKMDISNDSEKVTSSSISPNSISSTSSGHSMRNDNPNLAQIAPISSAATTISSFGDDIGTNVYNQNLDTNDPFDPLNLGESIPDTGCNWIDKALLDFFVD